MTQSTSRITYRKTKTGEWVAYGPAAAITAGQRVTVAKKNGETDDRMVEKVGRPFTVDGTEMAYGYLAQDAPRARTSSRAGGNGMGMCDECGTRRAVTTARDLSGLPGYVCGSCKRAEGTLSFA